MTTLQVSEDALKAAGFSKPAQANTFYPPGDAQTHLHLGVPTQYEGEIAQPGFRFVTYISIKVNDRFYAKLTKDETTGKFDPDISKDWPPGLLEPLTALGILAS